MDEHDGPGGEVVGEVSKLKKQIQGEIIMYASRQLVPR